VGGEDAEEPALLRTERAGRDETLVQTRSCRLAEFGHDALGLLALLVGHRRQSVVEDAVPRGADVPDAQSTFSHEFVRAGDVDAMRQDRVGQQSATDRHLRVGAVRSELPGVVGGQQEQQVLGDEHASGVAGPAR